MKGVGSALTMSKGMSLALATSNVTLSSLPMVYEFD